MAILNFPPTAGEPIDGSFTYSSDGVTYSWDGYKWTADTGSGGGGGDANHTDGPTPPTTGELADQWYNTDDGRLYTYTADSSGTLVWIDASPDSIAGGSGGGGGDGTTVNYNGASAWGSAAADGTINNGQNVASVTKTGTGIYDVVFTTPMANAEYAVNVTAQSTSRKASAVSKTVNGFTVDTCLNGETTRQDANFDFAVHSENAIAPPSGVGADAWGFVDIDGNMQGSFNASCSRIQAGNYQYTFDTPMPTANYSCVASPSTIAGGEVTASVQNKTINGFVVIIQDALQNGLSVNCANSFTVHASSTVTPTYTWTRDGTTLKPANDGDDVDLGSIQLNADGSSSFGGRMDSETIVAVAPQSQEWAMAAVGSQALIGGIYTQNSASTKIHLKASNASAGVFQINNNGDTWIGGTFSTSSPNITLYADGQIFSRNVITTTSLSGSGTRPVYADSSGGLTISSSDRKLKRNINTLPSQVEQVKALNPVSFNWINKEKLGDGIEIGFVAQEVEKVVPEVVRLNADGTLALDYSKLTATLTSALQTALTRIETLEETNASLEARLTALEGGNN